METIQLKIEYESALRRCSVTRTETLAGLKATIASLVGIQNCDLKYKDDENDLITIGSDRELQEFLASADAKSGKILRLIVAAKEASANGAGDHQAEKQSAAETSAPAASEVPPQAAPQQEREIPWANLARALSDPQVVERIQLTLQSPVITETISRASKAYVDAKGDIMMAGLIASQRIPALLALLAELLEDLPILRDLQQFFMTMWHNHMNGSEHQRGPVPPQMPFPFGMLFGAGGCGPRHGPGPHGPPHHQHPHCPPHHQPGHHHPHHHPGHHHPHQHPGQPQQQPQFQQKHFGVYCDGCGSDPVLKQASIQAEHHTRRGFINGLRFKSQAVNDFDLCETCKASDRFPDRVYGPFTTIQPPAQQQGEGCGNGRGARGGGGRQCGNGWWRGGGQRQQNWRAGQQEETTAPQAAAPAAKEEFDFVSVIRSALSKGSEALKEAAGDEQNDFAEMARAIAESLKPQEEEQQQPTTAVPVKKEDLSGSPVPVARPVQQQPAQSNSSDPFVKWAVQMNQLQTLGFDNLETYVGFLEEEKGDLDRVVARIVSRDL
jgi:hypothetical protein